MLRLLSYLKDHKLAAVASLFLTLAIIALDLYRPIVIGNAIDDYINSYYVAYGVVNEATDDTVSYDGKLLTKDYEGMEVTDYYQVFLYEDNYYLFNYQDPSFEEVIMELSEAEVSGDVITISVNGQKLTGSLMSEEDINLLRVRDFEGINHAAVRYFAALLMAMICNMGCFMILQTTGQRIIYTMRNQVFNHVHSLSLSFFNNIPIGTLVTRVTNDTESVNELFTDVLVKLFKNIVKIIGYAVVMASINLKMTGYAFLMLPIVFGVTLYFRYLSRKAYRLVRTALTDMNSFLSEHLSGMRLIQIFVREEEKAFEFHGKITNLYKAHFRETMTFAIFRPTLYGLSVIAMVLIIYNGSRFTLAGSLSLGTLFIFINYIKSFFEPIQELAEQFGTLQQSLASAEKIFKILDEKPEIVNPENPAELKEISGDIEFRNVWFAYIGEEYVLKDVSFHIHPGEKVAFVGATGAGKSSILNIMGRYYDIQKGQILIDGVDIKDIDLKVLRSNIGQVLQDVFIFTGDIESNITLDNEAISHEVVVEASKTSNADYFIDKLPGGFKEPVSERGATFSAGQRQLLAFARTLAYNPNVLVLDEATANIDTETESLITEALDRLMEGRTTIMVAHRLSTIQHADRIYVLDHGKLMESGSHQELLAMKGIYHKLYELQLATQ